jgi:hypothetical protein
LESLGGPNTTGLELWVDEPSPHIAANLLLEIDAIILRAFDLPPRLERKLLDIFGDMKARRPVPFEFPPYFPDTFRPTIPLWRYISSNFAQCTGAHLVETLPTATDESLAAVLEEIE